MEDASNLLSPENLAEMSDAELGVIVMSSRTLEGFKGYLGNKFEESDVARLEVIGADWRSTGRPLPKPSTL